MKVLLNRKVAYQCKWLSPQTYLTPLVGTDLQKLGGKRIFMRYVIDVKPPLLWMVDLIINYDMSVLLSCHFPFQKGYSIMNGVFRT